MENGQTGQVGSKEKCAAHTFAKALRLAFSVKNKAYYLSIFYLALATSEYLR